MRFLAIFILAYCPGFLAVLLLHVVALQMVTFPLAVMRSLAWPLWIAFGWPNGSALLMD